MSTEVEKCRQRTCDLPAAFAFFWPGSPRTPACPTHYLMAAAVADALGFQLRAEALDVADPADPVMRVPVSEE